MNKNAKVNKIAFAGILSAFSLGIMYFGVIFQSLSISFCAIGACFLIAGIDEFGITEGLYIFVTVSILGLILIPEKDIPIIYILFFGQYTLLRNVIEKLRTQFLKITIKYLVANIALAVYLSLIFFFKLIPINSIYSDNAIYAVGIFILYNIVFSLFDIFLKRIQIYYHFVIRKKIGFR